VEIMAEDRVNLDGTDVNDDKPVSIHDLDFDSGESEIVSNNVVQEGATNEEEENGLQTNNAPTYNNPNEQAPGLAEWIFKDVMGNDDELDFSTMTPEERDAFVAQSVLDINEHYEGLLAQQQAPQLDPYEVMVLNHIRNGGTVEDVMAPSIDINNKESVVREKIRLDNPTWEESEVESELIDLKNANKLDRYYKSSRPVIESKLMNWQNERAQYIERAQQMEYQQEQMQYQQDVNEILAAAQQFTGISNIQVPKSYIDNAVSYAVQINPETGNTYFIDSMQDPSKIIRLSILDLYFDQISEMLQSNVTNSFKQKLSPTPVAVQNSRSFKPEVSAQEAREKLDEIDRIGSF
jgi:hypothetical protein